MQLTSGHPFWPAQHGFIRTYEPLTESATCDVVIMGGGITGSLLALATVEAGYQTILVDCRNCGQGSTSATTALIQYEIDTHLVELTKTLGREAASTAYLACRAAIEKIEVICQSVQAGRFQGTRSFYLNSRRRDLKRLQEEYEARLQLGLEVEWLDSVELKHLFDCPVEGAILSRVAGTIDAYELTHALLHRAITKGLKVYARTQIESLSETECGVEIATNRGPTLKAHWAVVAAGYESLAYLKSKPRVSLHNT